MTTEGAKSRVACRNQHTPQFIQGPFLVRPVWPTESHRFVLNPFLRPATGPFPVSPVPDLAREVVHRLEPTGSPVWAGYPGRNVLPVSHCWLSFFVSLTIVYCRIKKLSTDNSSETLTQALSDVIQSFSVTSTRGRREAYLLCARKYGDDSRYSWSRQSQWSVRCGYCRCIFTTEQTVVGH